MRVTISTNVSVELAQDVEGLAEKRDISVSALLRESVRKEIQREELE